IDARTPIILTIQGAAFFRDKRKVDGFIDFSKQVMLGNKVFYVDCFGLKFPGWVRPEHIKTFLRKCFIPNSTKKTVDASLSTASKAHAGLFSFNGRHFRPACGWELLRRHLPASRIQFSFARFQGARRRGGPYPRNNGPR